MGANMRDVLFIAFSYAQSIASIIFQSRAKNEWSYTSTPPYAFIAWCLVKAQEQLYVYIGKLVARRPTTCRK
jgi:hypothetical protein